MCKSIHAKQSVYMTRVFVATSSKPTLIGVSLLVLLICNLQQKVWKPNLDDLATCVARRGQFLECHRVRTEYTGHQRMGGIVFKHARHVWFDLALAERQVKAMAVTSTHAERKQPRSTSLNAATLGMCLIQYRSVLSTTHVYQPLWVTASLRSCSALC